LKANYWIYLILLGDIEKSKIIGDLQNTKPQPQYKIHHTGEYAIIKLEAKVPIDAARRMVKEEVIEINFAYIPF
jgi:hypothetical protein